MSQSTSKAASTPVQVGANFTFRTRYKSIVDANTALRKYAAGIEHRDEWVYEENKMPIFLDTCVLLNLYDVSEKERVEFIKFIRKNKDRIYISSQVQREYNRRRILSVKGFKEKVDKTKNDILSTLAKVATTYQNEKEGVTNLANRNLIKYGMPQVETKLRELEEFLKKPAYNTELQEMLKQCSDFISQHVDEECENCWRNADFEYIDPVLEVIMEAKLLPSLSTEEQTYIADLYKKLRTPYDALKPTDKEQETITFPGAGDKDKPEDGSIEESVAWGDLYIYHEMLRFMKENKTDVVFMTRDVTKKDWIKKDHRAYVHYIVNGYEMTGHLMYILDADGVVPTFNTIESNQEDSDDDEISEKPVKPAIAVTDSDSSDSESSDDDSSDDFDGDNPFTKLSWIDLSTWNKTAKPFKNITKEQFIAELDKTTRWATSYGAGYVGESHFIYTILSQKHYDYESSRAVLEELIDDGKVDRKSETHDDHTFNCLVLKEKIGD
ncbi:MAG: hypothetical protein J6T94_03820 [Bacteroidaceae bacterium]|nr:hypothetical protein [Bacteroidaceae bacterium]